MVRGGVEVEVFGGAGGGGTGEPGEVKPSPEATLLLKNLKRLIGPFEKRQGRVGAYFRGLIPPTTPRERMTLKAKVNGKDGTVKNVKLHKLEVVPGGGEVNLHPQWLSSLDEFLERHELVTVKMDTAGCDLSVKELGKFILAKLGGAPAGEVVDFRGKKMVLFRRKLAEEGGGVT